MVVFTILIFVIVNMVINTYSGEIAFDSFQYYNEDGTTLTEEQLIEKLGQPDAIVIWNYTTDKMAYPVRSLLYEPNEKALSGYTYTYEVNSNLLQRIRIEGVEYEYSRKNHILALFRLTRGPNSSLIGEGNAYGMTNCGVQNFLVTGMTNKVLTDIRITYGTMYED